MKSFFLILLSSTALMSQIVSANVIQDIRGEDWRARQLKNLQEEGLRGSDYRIKGIAAVQEEGLRGSDYRAKNLAAAQAAAHEKRHGRRHEEHGQGQCHRATKTKCPPQETKTVYLPNPGHGNSTVPTTCTVATVTETATMVPNAPSCVPNPFLVANPSFEYTTINGLLTHAPPWAAVNVGDVAFRLPGPVSDEGLISGSNSFRLSWAPSAATRISGRISGRIQQFLPVEAGSTYTFSAYHRFVGGACRASWALNDEFFIPWETVETQDQWVKLSKSAFVMPTGAESARLVFSVDCPSGATVYTDDVVLQKICPEPEAVQPTTAAPMYTAE